MTAVTVRDDQDTPPGPIGVLARFAGQVRWRPQAIAIDDGDQRLSYAELADRVITMATSLVARDANRGPVGVLLPRGVDAVVAMLGAFQAGRAYVPLDPAYPDHRLRTMGLAAGVSTVVGASIDGLAADVLDPQRLPRAGGGAEPPSLSDPSPDRTAYVIFTSGSTGQPKGVCVTHGNMTAFLEWIRDAFEPAEFGITPTATSPSFDPSIMEVLGALTFGGTLRIVPHPVAVSDIDPGPSILVSTPSVVAELHRAGRLPTTLATIVVGGEVLPPALAEDLLRLPHLRRLINAYGPTEATVIAAAHEVTRPVPVPVPIGRAVGACTVLVVDDRIEPVPDGVSGELLIVGPQVAAGYSGDPELSTARFVQVEDATGIPVTAYRTGDVGTRRSDGVLEFSGRSDRQVKVRGFRVEPAEVEAAVEQLPDVAHAVVVPVGHGPDATLVAYVVPIGSTFDGRRARTELRTVLADYLVPSQFVPIEAVPLTVQGKVDLRALPNPRDVAMERSRTGTLDGDQQIVADAASEVLGFAGSIGPEDDLVDDLGASSLAVIRILALLEEQGAGRLPLRRALDDTTVRGLAALLRSEATGQGRRRDGEAPPGDGSPPLFFIHAYVGSVLRFRRLLPSLAHGHRVVAVHVHDVDRNGSHDPPSVVDLAEAALAEIRAVQPAGPYLLCGHSAGGIVAFEVAQRLRAAGDGVGGLLLIDSPASRRPLDYYWAEAVLNWPEIQGARHGRMELFRSMARSRLSVTRGRRDDDGLAGTVQRTSRYANIAMKRYRPHTYRGDLTLLWTEQGRRMARGQDGLGWRRLTRGTVDATFLPGGHITLFDPPHVEGLGRAVDRFLDRFDQAAEARPATAFRRSTIGDELERALAGRRRPPNLLLFGNYGNGNVGDEGILAGILDACRGRARVTVVSRDPESIEQRHGVPALRLGSSALAWAIARSDIVAVGGGGLFGNGMKATTGMLPVVVRLAQTLGKETMFLGTGAYSSSPRVVQQLLGSAASRSSVVCVRDDESASVLGVEHARVVPDPAMGLRPAPPAAARATLRAAGVPDDVPLLGVSLKPCGYSDRDDRQVEIALEAIDWWHKRCGGHAVLLCLSDRGDNGLGHVVSDVTLSEAVLARTPSAAQAHRLEPALPPGVVKAVVGQLDLIVAHRLHAQIFAWSMGTPLVGLSYERKSDVFLQETGSKRFDLWGLEPGDLTGWLDDHFRPPDRPGLPAVAR